MDKKKSLSSLLYIQEHRSCRNYLEKVENGFKYLEFQSDEVIREDKLLRNCLLFVLEGECLIDCNRFKDRLFLTDTMVLLPKMAMAKIEVTAGTRLLALLFDIPMNICDKFTLQSLAGMCKELDYDFEPLGIRHPLTPYLEVVTHCLINKMDCGHFHTMLQQELFFLLRGFYLKEELAFLFYPIISSELSFKDFVIENYLKAKDVNELVSLSRMSKSNFCRKFREVFGETAKQWLLKQQDLHIINKVTTSETTIVELMDEFHFESQAHFTYYCKTHFNCTPKELLMKYQAENQ